MDDLIVKSLRGEATDFEARQLDHWRTGSPDNEREYQSFVRLWHRASEPEGPVVGPPPRLDTIVRVGEARRARGQAKAARRAVLLSPWTGIGLIAAAATVVIFVSLPSDEEQSAPTRGLFPVESSSSSADVTTLGLSDGSVVRMMPDSRVEFPATVDRREVTLEGRAFFAVAADPIPFVVRTHLGEVTVRGTRFEVFAAPGEVRIAVVEGTLRIEGESGSAEVGPGQVTYLRPGLPPMVLNHADMWSMLDWDGGLLIFEATPLSMVAVELSRHFGREVSLVDEDLGKVRITAWFEDEPIEEVVSAVCLVASTRCELTEEEVSIGR